MNKLEEGLIKTLFGIESTDVLFQAVALDILNKTQEFVKQMEEEGKTNEQWFIDWEMEMNKVTVKDHASKD